MIAIVDYGAGNIFSVKNALDYLGCDSVLTSKKADLENADSIILPGVGAFPAAMKKLDESGLVEVIKQQAVQKPFLGICLGMQLLFEKSFEFEECAGLSLIKGYVDKMTEPDLVIPHMGWNKLEYDRSSPLLTDLARMNMSISFIRIKPFVTVTRCMHIVITVTVYPQLSVTAGLFLAVSSTLKRVGRPD